MRTLVVTASGRSLALLLMLGIIPLIRAQNLVPNNGFDVYTVCPNTSSQSDLTPPWTTVPNATGTPDYMNACFSGNQGVPNNFYGSQAPVSGDGYYGLITYYNGQEIREYMSVPLNCTLIAGVEYEVGFHISHSDNFRFASDRIGAYLSSGPLAGSGSAEALAYTPQIVNPAGNILDDDQDWTLISGTFVAIGNEDQLTIGNFHTDAQTQTIVVNPSSSLQWAYYYVDEVYVIPIGATPGLSNDTTLCAGTVLELDVTTTGATYLWQDGSEEALYTIAEPGSYWVQITTGECVLSDTINVSFIDPPSVDLGADTTLCFAEEYALDASVPGATYLWHDGSTGPMNTVNGPGTYWVQVSLEGCIAGDTLTVDLLGLATGQLGNDTLLCPGETLLLDAFMENAEYHWQDGSTSAIFPVTTAGVFWVQVSSQGCTSGDTIQVAFVDVPEFTLGNDTALCMDSSLVLGAGQLDAIIWSDGTSADSITINGTGTYWVQGQLNGCTVGDTLAVQLIYCDTEFEMPNIFTPNGDGHNDRFSTLHDIHIENALLTIHGRWGDRLFTTANINKGWNGEINGEPCPEGTYYWMIEYGTLERRSKQGHVTLLR